MDRITNEVVLRKIGKKIEVMPNIKIKKFKEAYLGHIMRNTKYRLLQLIMQGKINSSRGLIKEPEIVVWEDFSGGVPCCCQ